MIANLLIPYLGFAAIGRWDAEEKMHPSEDICRQIILMAAVSAVCGAVILPVSGGQEEHLTYKLIDGTCLGIVSGCMIFASATDVLTNKVYDFVWWTAVTAEFLLYIQYPLSLWELAGLSIFLLMQELFCAKFYGRADCHAFCICAVAESIFGMDITGFLIHMILSFMLLATVQFLKGNVTDRGKLKTPVPFIPYIRLAFWCNFIIQRLTSKIYCIEYIDLI